MPWRRLAAAAALLLALSAQACAALPGSRPAAAPTLRSIRAADLRTFTYNGACGYEPVRAAVRFQDGHQASPPLEEPPYPASEARITDVRYARVEGAPAEGALVSMECSIGKDLMLAVHLVLPTATGARDLGPVLFADSATSLPARVDGGLVMGTETYLRDTDSTCCPSGRRAARVGLGGGVPQRLGLGGAAIDVKAPAAAVTPSGVVTVAIAQEYGSAFDTGVLVEGRHVAVASDIYRSGCPGPTRVYTSRGDAIAVNGMAYDARHGLMLLTLASPHPDAPLAVAPAAPAPGAPMLLWQSSGLAPDAASVAPQGGAVTDPERHREELVGVRAPGVSRDAALPIAHMQVATDRAGRAVAIVDRQGAAHGDALLAVPLRYASALHSAPPADFSDC